MEEHAEAGEVQYNPKPRPTIHSRVHQESQIFDKGQERELAESGISASDLERLTEMGVIENFEPVIKRMKAGAKKESDSEEGTEELELPPVPKMKEWLAGMDDPDQIREIQKQDDRKQAAPLYEKRLAELEGS